MLIILVLTVIGVSKAENLFVGPKTDAAKCSEQKAMTNVLPNAKPWKIATALAPVSVVNLVVSAG